MHIYEEFSYPAPFAQIWKMYSDPEFSRALLSHTKLHNPMVELDAGGDGLVINTAGTLPVESLPTQARSFVKGPLRLEMAQTWRRGVNDANGSITLKVHGAPVSLASTCRLRQTDSAVTLRVMDGDLTVSVPFVGPTLERQMARLLPAFLQWDSATAKIWLENN